ncbi:MAG TPA: aminotransferase class V-fold PLP-dependent enzyme [Chitinophagales bacterium]|nr:aminotransferase class V-fold PLP-dependent enzyme [Chitinophagales bacterium]HAE36076.1 selenocysteine lyase [Bacteroidota bacterium]HQU75860.1 aminotransferase class V-fold PLP-dependent enzyme [Chitinophagales bacterium]HRX22778.1 aminotransferase class V-fold PLP-dependent enzyme [Chitinophagales bacterium]
MYQVSAWETYFKPFHDRIIGVDETFSGPYGEKKIIYADWTASGRLDRKIEEKFLREIYPIVANTHTDTNYTGSAMTRAYHHAMGIIKAHVHAGPDDVLISSNSGMTGVVNKLQRILGFKLHEDFRNKVSLTPDERPVVFITHMEHHSNQTSWLETIAEVRIIDPDENGLVDLKHFAALLEEYRDRPLKIAAVTSCSNVTGIMTPYHTMAGMIHRAGGYCFVDFACSAPYIDINMHPDEQDEYLDAVYFSPHKFLGGPGAPGAVVFNKKLYHTSVPDHPGGGTVKWTDPWGYHLYLDDIELREDGGTPAFLGTMRTALSILLKEEMGTEQIAAREKEIMDMLWPRLKAITNLHILAGEIRERLPVISFYIDDLHYNLVVRMLNDRFGIQVRGGCACAGTYGHYLLYIDSQNSEEIANEILSGDFSHKPGWVRLSLHPTTTNDELEYILQSIESLCLHASEWMEDYDCDLQHLEIRNKVLTTDPSEITARRLLQL